MIRSSPALAPASCSSKPGIRRPAPSSISWSRPSPPSKFDAVDRADVVGDDEVALARLALGGLESREVLAQVLELVLDAVLVDGRVATADLKPLVVAERRRRADADLDAERQRLALLGHVAEVELRLADGMDLGGVDGLGVPAVDRPADRLVEDVRATHPANDDGRRDLPLTEARDAHVAGQLLRGAVDALLNLGGGDFRLDADARLGQLGDGGLEGFRHVAANDTVGG